ncbi:ABC-2 transporter permease [Paenibacillus sp. 481]|uniref:ABC-2 transporter permease n=1 Tax=Paenibacillus sp. 481 TaxID=2835869 RepID=UPI001E549DA8|nr:ABC-2 transporter permease [Paenibacillus sp. 481]UHA73391.1 ABC-2 transporter permease [Paenibacillus sp. 481]
MLNLLRKDFIALKSSLWIVVFYLVVFSVAFMPKELSMHFVGIYTAFASVSLATMIDSKNHNHHFLITLPISRKHIVQAKYIIAIICTFFGIFSSYGIHSLVKLAVPELNMQDYSIVDLLIPTGIVLVIVSIYLPLFYTLSKKGTHIINVVFLIILIVLAHPAAYVMNKISEQGSTSDTLLFFIPIGILLLFIASYYLTVHLFTRKDL